MSEIKLWYQDLYPSDACFDILDKVLDDDLDVLIIGQYGSGAVPYRLIPTMKKAQEKNTPVFSIRQTRSDRWFTEWSDYKDEILPGKYDGESEAIQYGLIPLQKDLKKIEEVTSGIKEIYETVEDSNERIEKVTEKFSSPAFNERLNEIRKAAGLTRIIYTE